MPVTWSTLPTSVRGEPHIRPTVNERTLGADSPEPSMAVATARARYGAALPHGRPHGSRLPMRHPRYGLIRSWTQPGAWR